MCANMDIAASGAGCNPGCCRGQTGGVGGLDFVWALHKLFNPHVFVVSNWHLSTVIAYISGIYLCWIDFGI